LPGRRRADPAVLEERSIGMTMTPHHLCPRVIGVTRFRSGQGVILEAGMVRIVTVKDVAAFLKLKEATVCNLASEGKLPGFKLGKAWRFDMDEVERWIAGMQRSGIGRLEGAPGNINKEVEI
jgi:excisionase family DNA binding protein